MSTTKQTDEHKQNQVKIAIIAGVFSVITAIVSGTFLLISAGKNNTSGTPASPTFIITVPANTVWVNTGIHLTSGQALSISSSGTTNLWGGTPVSTSDANGQLSRFCLDTNCSLSGHEYGTLVGKIENGQPFRIGSYLETSASSSGTLYLGINENADGFYDNIGELSVTIVVR